MKIAHKLWLMLAAMVAIVWAVGLYAALVTHHGLEASVQQGAVSEARTLIESVDQLLDTEIRRWLGYAQNEHLRNALKASNLQFDNMVDAEQYISQRDELWQGRSEHQSTHAIRETAAQPLSREFSEMIKAMGTGLVHKPVAEIFVTNRYGANVAQSNITSDYRQSDERWWQHAMRDGQFVGDAEFDESSGEFAIEVCVRVDDEKQEPLGVMKVVLNILQTLDIVHRKQQSAGNTNAKSWTAVDRNGTVLASTRPELARDKISKRHPLFAESGRVVNDGDVLQHGLHNDRQSILCAVAKATTGGYLQKLGWHALIEQEESVALAPAHRMTTRVLAFAIAASVCALLLGFAVSRTMTRNVQKLLTGVEEFSKENFEYTIDEGGHDEFAAIAKGLNEMAASLRTARDQVVEQTEELEKQNATLAAEVFERQRTETELTEMADSLQHANAELDRLLTEAANQSGELLRAKGEAEAASKSKSEFLSNMSHELRTPLTAILGFTESLLEEGDIESAPPERIEALQTISRNGEHLLQLINDILDISKIEAGKMAVESIECSPLDIARHAVEGMQFRAKAHNLTLKLHCDTPIPEKINSDPTRIKQILINLISNAVKFTELGGVDIRAAYLEDDACIAFKVQDTGIGMSPDQVNRLFKPFTQADTSTTRRFGGTGLGLTITKRLVKMLGGEISVSSKPGEGTTFQFTIATGDAVCAKRITLSDLETCAKDELRQKTKSQQNLNCRVLLAEDGPDNQRLISFVLKKAGADVTVVENGQLAYEAATEALTSRTPFDVILMDMQMPVLDGYSAATKLRDGGYELPIIAATAHALTGEREKCLAAGCDDYTSKPINRAELIDKVAHWASTAKQQMAAGLVEHAAS